MTDRLRPYGRRGLIALDGKDADKLAKAITGGLRGEMVVDEYDIFEALDRASMMYELVVERLVGHQAIQGTELNNLAIDAAAKLWTLYQRLGERLGPSNREAR